MKWKEKKNRGRKERREGKRDVEIKLETLKCILSGQPFFSRVLNKDVRAREIRKRRIYANHPTVQPTNHLHFVLILLLLVLPASSLATLNTITSIITITVTESYVILPSVLLTALHTTTTTTTTTDSTWCFLILRRLTTVVPLMLFHVFGFILFRYEKK